MLAPQVLLEMMNGPVTPMLVKFSATFWGLVSVTVLAELVVPTTVVLKLRLAAESVTGALPVPLRLTVCGLLIALSAKVSVPVAAPSAAGVKVTPTVQVGARGDARSARIARDGERTPAETEMPVNVSAVLRRLVTVTVFAALVLPTASEPKLRLVEEKVTGALPLPVTLTVCVPALSVIVRTPEAEPTTVGEKTTEMVHDAAGAMLPLQVFVCAERSCDRNAGDLQRPCAGALHGDVASPCWRSR